MNVEQLNYTWTIENFGLADLDTGKSFSSPIFSGEANNSCKWRLDMYPNGLTTANRPYASLILTSLSCIANVRYKFGILSVKRKIQAYIQKGTTNFKGISNERFIKGDRFILKKYLLEDSFDYLSHNKTVIFCELNVTTGIEYTSGKLTQPQSQFNDLGRDFSYLFENRNFTDVILSADGKKFYVLKAILAARSPIFKSMFEQDMEEAKITRIEIADVDHEVVREMLRYIYTGKVFNLEYLAPGLLAASEKYELEGLKTLCASSMAGNVTIENAAEFYVLSDTYLAVDLKMQVKRFIAAHASSVVRTPGFKSMIQTYPHLVEEAFDALGDMLSNSCGNNNFH